jgi:hypothetical protein
VGTAGSHAAAGDRRPRGGTGAPTVARRRSATASGHARTRCSLSRCTDGTPVARLVAVADERSFAATRGMFPPSELHIADDFDELPDDIATAYGMR